MLILKGRRKKYGQHEHIIIVSLSLMVIELKDRLDVWHDVLLLKLARLGSQLGQMTLSHYWRYKMQGLLPRNLDLVSQMYRKYNRTSKEGGKAAMNSSSGFIILLPLLVPGHQSSVPTVFSVSLGYMVLYKHAITEASASLRVKELTNQWTLYHF